MPRKALIGIVLMVAVLTFTFSVGILNAQEFGTNWSATFFNSPNLTGTAAAVSGINGINFNWGTGQPIINGVAVSISGCPSSTTCTDNFSARFTSVQNFQAGNYTFTASSDDGMRVFIDGAVVLDVFVGRALTTNTFTRTMTAGAHTLTVEYFEGIDNAVLQFQWGFGGTVPTLGPSPTPGPTNTPAPTGLPQIPGGSLTATIIRAPVLNVRAGPSVYTDRIASVLRGQTYAVIGRDERARWFLLQLSDRQGWVLGYYVFINGNEFNAPIVSDFALTGNPAAQSPTGVVAQSFATLKLRSEPNIYSAQIGRITWGGAVAVVGRTRAGDWWQVVWKGTTGWAVSGYLRVVEGDLSSVPIVP